MGAVTSTQPIHPVPLKMGRKAGQRVEREWAMERKRTVNIKLREKIKRRLELICKGHNLQITHSTSPGLKD